MKLTPSPRQDVEVLKALAQPARLQILEILQSGPACVCELVEQTGQRQAYVSQHLMVLKKAGLVDYHSEGQKNYYRLNQTTIAKTLQALRRLGQ